MVRINSLFSLEDIKENYFLTDNLEVVNVQTGKKLKVWVSVRGYPTVTLQAKSSIRGKNIPMHKLVALAFINNGPYELIEHKDDNKLDYRPENLKFSNKSSNGKNAFITGHHVRQEKIFQLQMVSGEIYKGTMKELSKLTGISRATLYDRVYKERNPLKGGKPKTRRNKVLTIEELV